MKPYTPTAIQLVLADVDGTLVTQEKVLTAYEQLLLQFAAQTSTAPARLITEPVPQPFHHHHARSNDEQPVR